MSKVTAHAGPQVKSGDRHAPDAADPCGASCVDGSEVLTPKEDRCRMIAEAAYYRAEARSFAPGHEIEDWLQAEKDVDAARASAAGD